MNILTNDSAYRLEAIDELLQPTPIGIVHDLAARLFAHYGLSNKSNDGLKAHYVHALHCYPEDLLCACYCHCINHYQELPDIHTMLAFMEPERTCRASMMQHAMRHYSHKETSTLDCFVAKVPRNDDGGGYAS